MQAERGGGQIIRSFYKCDVVSAHSNTCQTHGMQSEYKGRITVNANFIELAIIEACRLLISASG